MFTSRYLVYDILPPNTDLRTNLRWCSNGRHLKKKIFTTETMGVCVWGGRGEGGVSRRAEDRVQIVYVPYNNNNVHLSCAHQRPERSHDTY